MNDTRDLADPSPNLGPDCESTSNTCTLRAAIQRANHKLGTHTIRLPAGTYRITRGARGEDDAEFGDFDIKGDIVIRGAGARSTSTDAQTLDRVFDVRSGSLILVDLTVRNGLTGGSDTNGGGIRAKANLTLSRVHVRDNTSAGSGGAIWTDDDLSIVQSTIFDNAAIVDNGALVADNFASILTKDISIRESTFSGNSGHPVGANNTGGGVRITGNFDVQILYSTFANNNPGAIRVLTVITTNSRFTTHSWPIIHWVRTVQLLRVIRTLI